MPSMRDPTAMREPTWRARATAGGIFAGVMGAAVLAAFHVVANWLTGRDVWLGMKAAALPLLGAERALRTGFEAGPVILGLLGHFAVAIGWALPFGLVFYGLNRGATVAAGIAWGVVAWASMYSIVLPLLGAHAFVHATPAVAAIFDHVLFGATVGAAFLPFQRQDDEASPWLRGERAPL